MMDPVRRNFLATGAAATAMDAAALRYRQFIPMTGSIIYHGLSCR
jgi:hypothetical protein